MDIFRIDSSSAVQRNIMKFKYRETQHQHLIHFLLLVLYQLALIKQIHKNGLISIESWWRETFQKPGKINDLIEVEKTFQRRCINDRKYFILY